MWPPPKVSSSAHVRVARQLPARDDTVGIMELNLKSRDRQVYNCANNVVVIINDGRRVKRNYGTKLEEKSQTIRLKKLC